MKFHENPNCGTNAVQ